MKSNAVKKLGGQNTARNAWFVFGGLLALGVIVMTIRELPSMARELRLMRM